MVNLTAMGFAPAAEVPSAWLRTGSFGSGKGPKTIVARRSPLITKTLPEFNSGTTRCAQTGARRIFGFSKPLDHAAGDRKGRIYMLERNLRLKG